MFIRDNGLPQHPPGRALQKPQLCVASSLSMERRVDPADGAAYTFQAVCSAELRHPLFSVLSSYGSARAPRRVRF